MSETPRDRVSRSLEKHPRIRRLLDTPWILRLAERGFRVVNAVRALSRGTTQLVVLETQQDELVKKQRELLHRLAHLEVELKTRDQALKEALLAQRRFLPTAARAPRSVGVTRSVEFEQSLERLASLAPHAFPLWKELLDVNETTYRDLPTHSCSVEGHQPAERFREFVRPYVGGTVLDIGCGPQATPSYLRDVEPSRLAGVDPLEPYESHPFEFHRGVSEFLPWEDGTFDAVVTATSLDHVLLLDVSLREFRRVLRPDGVFLAWVAFIDGAIPYDPYNPSIKAVDEFHLFHFDVDWFEEALAREYEIVESLHLDAMGSSFYAFRPSSNISEAST